MWMHNYFQYGTTGVPVLRKKDLDIVHHSDPGHDAEVFMSPALFPSPNSTQNKSSSSTSTAGNGDEGVPSTAEVAVGKERYEYIMQSQGKDAYHGLTLPLSTPTKGTKSHPIEVLSPDSDRYVGCIGHPGEQHGQVWFQVTEDGHRYWGFGHNRCSECGNHYKLKRIEIPFPTIN